MLFRINNKNFLLHMIDYFTNDELLNFQYAILSAGIAVHGSEKENVVKYPLIYPSHEIADRFLDDQDTDLLRRTYRGELKSIIDMIFVNFVKPIVEFHHNILFVNLEKEDVYTDILVEFIREQLGLPCIDLNELFMTGETELFRIDRRELHDRNVKLSRGIAKRELMGFESTDDGKLHLIRNVMTEKQKLAKLKELDVGKLKESDLDRLDELLIGAWLTNPPQ